MLLIVWGYSNTGTGKCFLTSLKPFSPSGKMNPFFFFFFFCIFELHFPPFFFSILILNVGNVRWIKHDARMKMSVGSLNRVGVKINRLCVWNILFKRRKKNTNKNNIFRPFFQSLFAYIYSILCVFHILRRVRPCTSQRNTVWHGNIARFFSKNVKASFLYNLFHFCKTK